MPFDGIMFCNSTYDLFFFLIFQRYLIIGKEHCMINWIQSKSGASIVVCSFII